MIIPLQVANRIGELAGHDRMPNRTETAVSKRKKREVQNMMKQARGSSTTPLLVIRSFPTLRQ